jgi:hypothetical protein
MKLVQGLGSLYTTIPAIAIILRDAKLKGSTSAPRTNECIAVRQVGT